MVEINLLPWRDYSARYQKKQMQILFALIFLVGVMCWLVMFASLSWQEKKVRVRIATLKQSISHYGLPSATVIKPGFHFLLNQRKKTIKLFHELAYLDEKNVCFTKMIRNKNKIYFSGQAHSAVELTYFLTHWQAGKLFSEVKIEQIEQQKNKPLQFRIQALESAVE